MIPERKKKKLWSTEVEICFTVSKWLQKFNTLISENISGVDCQRIQIVFVTCISN